MTSTATYLRHGVNAGKAVKVPVDAATTANITLSAEQTIDGVAVVDGDRVLVKDQTDGTENGIYIVSTGDWQRAPDWDGAYDITTGTVIYVVTGTVNTGLFVVTTTGDITIGSTSVTISNMFDMGDVIVDSIMFGDGDTGFTEPVDDVLRIRHASTETWYFDSTIMGSNNSGGGLIGAVAATATVPGFYFNGDADTGIGRAAADSLSAIAGGAEISRWTSSGLAMQAGQILAGDGTALLPSISFGSDPNSGFYWPATPDTIYVALGGNDLAFFNTSYMGGVTAGSGRTYLGAASATTPGLLPYGTDPNTGIGGTGVDVLTLITGGVAALSIDASQHATFAANTYLGDAFSHAWGDGSVDIYGNSTTDFLYFRTASTNAFAVDSSQSVIGDNASAWGLLNEAASTTNPTMVPSRADTDTGIGGDGLNVLSLIAGGVSAAQFNASGQALFTAGTTALPSISFIADPNTGIYNSGADQMILTTGGTARLTVGSAGIQLDQTADQILLPSNNDATAPTIAFTSDTGFYESAADILTVAVAGGARWSFTGDNFIGANVTNAPALYNTTPSSTVPTLAPNKADSNTGIGWQAADHLSLITGGVERVRLTDGGGVLIAEVAAADTDVGGYGQLWVRNDTPNVLVFTDDAGSDNDLTGASSKLSGDLVQHVYNMDSAVATGTTQIPMDDTIPQNTEGTEFMTQAITPTNASNILIIDVAFTAACSATVDSYTAALFQDSTAGALAATSVIVDGAAEREGSGYIRHIMVAGTTSATTFKLRIGPQAGATITFNGVASGRLYGGVAASSMSIMEIKV